MGGSARRIDIVGGRIALLHLPAPMAVHLRTLGRLGVLESLLFPWLSLRWMTGISCGHVLAVFEVVREVQGGEPVVPA
jgi:hypothetical protein